MNKRHIKTIIIVFSLIVASAGAIVIINNLANSKITEQNELITQTDDDKLPEWKKEALRKANTRPAARVATEYGDFYYVPTPNPYPREQVVNLDNDYESVTSETKQVILNGFYYEKN
ncbi:hypothetical protein [Paenibacillus faecalis]|uniref:hypothetical protein n=1 Tax=Paenibacillus faecalis TaxID=2079532 RepID=UPI000D109D8F|nr:hypothetical protein [Paenibacillus faecalis]